MYLRMGPLGQSISIILYQSVVTWGSLKAYKTGCGTVRGYEQALLLAVDPHVENIMTTISQHAG